MSAPAGNVPAGKRLLILHAHPDDESIMTGGTIARYLAEGVDVRVLTFTLGEEGEVIGQRWAQLAADPAAGGGADQLGGFRIHELFGALRALTPTAVDLTGQAPLEPRFLGGAGRWRDSGMAGTPSAEHPRALIGAPIDQVVEALVAEIVAFAPQVIVGYDAAGTYGHPDHRRVHEAGVAALEPAREALGGLPIKMYESVTEESALRAGLDAAADRVPADWRMPEPGELPSYPDEAITAQIDVSAYLGAKVAALRAHATQVTVAASGTEYALSNNILQPIGAVEHFIRTDVGSTLDAVRETDLFAGVS